MTPTEERIDVRLPAGSKDRLRRIARERGLTMSALIRRLLLGLERIEPAE